MKTLGNLIPRLRGLPGYEAISGNLADGFPRPVSVPSPSPRAAEPGLALGPFAAELAARPPGPGRARVGLLSPCLFQGGAEAWMLTLARTTDPAKIAWRGCAVMPGGIVDPAIRDALAALMPVAQGWEQARALAAASDVLVTWAIDGLPGILQGLPNPPRVVSAVHAPVESEWGQTVYGRPEAIDRWVAVSELALAALPEASRAAASASVIWNAVDLNRLEVRRDRAVMRSAWGVPADVPVAGYLGRLTEEKDPSVMIRLARNLPEPWHVVVVGDGWMRDGLRRETEGLDRFHLVGPDPAAGDVLNAFTTLVVPSRYESFGLTLAEGLWMGKPVVSTDVGIARLAPGMTRVIPFGADGPASAAEVLGTIGTGPADAAINRSRADAAEAFRPRIAPDRFGAEWTDLLVDLTPEPVSYPGAVRMASNFVGAAIAHLRSGLEEAGPAARAERKAACEACPLHEPRSDRCVKCGCGLDRKRAWASSACPDVPPRWKAC